MHSTSVSFSSGLMRQGYQRPIWPPGKTAPRHFQSTNRMLWNERKATGYVALHTLRAFREGAEFGKAFGVRRIPSLSTWTIIASS